MVDKRARGGKLYLKKEVVVDVSQPTVCDVHFPDIRETVQVGRGQGHPPHVEREGRWLGVGD